MDVKPKIGLLVTALLEDDYNKTGHIRPHAQKAAQEMAEILGPFAQVIFPGLVEEESHAQNAAEVFNREQIECIIFAELAYTKGLVPLRTFLSCTVPIIIWNTQFLTSYPENTNFDLIMLNSGMCGLPEIGQMLLRIRRPFWVVTGSLRDPKALQELKEWTWAAGAIQRLKDATIGVIGHPFEGMADLRIDEVSLRTTLGPVCWPVEGELVANKVDHLSDQSALDLIREEKEKYGSIEVPEETLIRSAKLAIALEETTKEKSLDAVALFDQIWLNDSRVGIIPSYGTSRMVAMGIPFTCEADVPQAVSMLVFEAIAGHSTFLENYVMDFEQDSIILSHDGHGNPSLALSSQSVKMKPSIYYKGVHGFGASFEYAYRTGLVTLLSLGYVGKDQWKFIICEGESIHMKPRAVVAPQMAFRYPKGSIAEYATKWCASGASHHHALAYGQWTGTLVKIAHLLGVEYEII